MEARINDSALDTIFRSARTQNKWLDKPVTHEQLVQLYDLMKWGPTSQNSFPIRIVFVTKPAAKERLKPLVSEGNRPKVASAPVSAILGYDTKFYEWLPRLFPHRDMRFGYLNKPQHAETTAFRNSSLQGAYFIIAARALGLDCGPMSGFDNAAVDREFFPGEQMKSNFICSIGYGDSSGVFERLPRPTFSEACRVE
ncbi:MAG TPA: malonic semialdehyde reductase [Casimicrobiaceae bacterium]|nr:malonic semialdehyde reductase [Casimicrobiaceae bacterium]